MGKVAVTTYAIWLSGIEGDAPLLDRLVRLRTGEPIELEIGGTIGGWERIDYDEAGRLNPGLKPIGPMREAWAKLVAAGDGTVEIRGAAPTYLADFGHRLRYWDIPESRIYVTDKG